MKPFSRFETVAAERMGYTRSIRGTITSTAPQGQEAVATSCARTQGQKRSIQ
jgi:hypothetical protein